MASIAERTSVGSDPNSQTRNAGIIRLVAKRGQPDYDNRTATSGCFSIVCSSVCTSPAFAIKKRIEKAS
jgi:hypothetical protein